MGRDMPAPETEAPLEAAGLVTPLADAFATIVAHVRASNAKARRFRVVYEDDDGQRGVLLMPKDAEGEADPGLDLTPKQHAIRQAVLEMPAGELTNNDEIARRSGWPNTRDTQDFIRFLATAGLLKPAKRGWKRA